MKKILLLISFLLPIFISSFNKTTFLFSNKDKNIIIYLTDLDLYLDLNDYVTGVVASEMPALFNEEALKAQAVASRSFATSKMENNYLELTSGISAQVYSPIYKLQEKWQSDFDKYYQKISNCVKSTNNEVIKRNNKILRTYYFSMSNGYTENSQTVFNDTTFTSVKSLENENTPNYKFQKTFSAEELQKILNISNIDIQSIERSNTNHVSTITINNKIYTGIQFRKLLNLRSTDFTIQKQDNNYIITTIGYGHGVGMSQYGANQMAKEGSSYKEILNHYYENTEISEI